MIALARHGCDRLGHQRHCPVQQAAADRRRTTGISPTLPIASDTTGGVIGQMASPQNLGIAAASVKQDARESTLFRKTLPCSLGRLVLLGALGFLQSTVLSFMVPRHPGSSVRPAGGSPLAMMTPAASMMLRL